MILIDSVFVNVGGTKVLLEYFLSKLSKNSEELFILLDYRSENNLDLDLTGFNHKYARGFVERKRFYKDNQQKFSKILCFGNLPPNYKMNTAEVFTYFHQQLFLDVPADLGFVQKIVYNIKTKILRSLINNSDQWLVQSSLMSEKLSKKYGITINKIKILPFYPPLVGENNYSRIKNSFIYVSNSNPHKNHRRLIDAFCNFYDKTKIGKLTLTIPSSATEILSYLSAKEQLGYPIINVGFLKREKLYEQYNMHEYLVFPSLAESFGLGLVEAIDCGCKVIAADLPYTYQVCEPSLTFDPMNSDSICEAFLKTQQLDIVSYPRKKVNDNIDVLLNLIMT